MIGHSHDEPRHSQVDLTSTAFVLASSKQASSYQSISNACILLMSQKHHKIDAMKLASCQYETTIKETTGHFQNRVPSSGDTRGGRGMEVFATPWRLFLQDRALKKKKKKNQSCLVDFEIFDIRPPYNYPSKKKKKKLIVLPLLPSI